MISTARAIPRQLSHPSTRFQILKRTMAAHRGPSTDAQEFARVLASSTRVLALCGAGLSAASGLETFRGAGGIWRNYDAMTLATPQAFRQDPGLVWLFYSHRRHKALQAAPNPGHYALTELSKKMPGFITLTQNVDGLSQRANHPREQLKLLHGTLFDIKCFSCDYVEQNNYNDPFHPSLAASSSESLEQPLGGPTIPAADLPHCPRCQTGLLRPGVVWFNEQLPKDTLAEVDRFIDAGPIDLIMVIGTTATVYPAASYVGIARDRGARVALINMDAEDLGTIEELRDGDFLFQGDSAKILPEILKPVIGELSL